MGPSTNFAGLPDHRAEDAMIISRRVAGGLAGCRRRRGARPAVSTARWMPDLATSIHVPSSRACRAAGGTRWRARRRCAEPLSPGADGLWRATEQLRLFGQALSHASARRNVQIASARRSCALDTLCSGRKRLTNAAFMPTRMRPTRRWSPIVRPSPRSMLACLPCMALARGLMIVDAVEPGPMTQFLRRFRAPSGNRRARAFSRAR